MRVLVQPVLLQVLNLFITIFKKTFKNSLKILSLNIKMAKTTAKATGTKTTASKKTTTTTKKTSSKTTAPKAAPTKAKTTTKTKTTTKEKTATPSTSSVPSTTKRTRRVVDKDSILSDFDTLLTQIEGQIEIIKTSGTKTPVGMKYFKGLSRQLKQLRGDVGKNIKVKRQINKDGSKTSGFLKPVSVSDAVSSFAGWKKGELHSRVEVTKYICDYVKSNDLQNPKDRRQILPDKKLRSLLSLKEKESEPLTYYSLQRCIQPHFIKA
jgi:chromatin remodeling complex protein RSC6